jgi:predicted DNA-binding protein
MLRFNFYLTLRQRDALQKLSTKTGLTVAELIRRSVDAYLKRAP